MGIILAIFVGLVIGQLINYLSDVLPEARSISKPVCKHCSFPLTWTDYLLYKNCKNCHYSRSWRAYIVQLLSLIASVLVWNYPPEGIGYALGILILTFFGVVLVIDIEYRLILHPVSLAGALLGLITGLITKGIVPTLIGGAAGFAIMLVFYIIGAWFAKYRAKKMGNDDGEEALGFGDVMLAGVLGLMLGWPLIWFGLVLGILLGGVISLLIIIFLIISGKYKTMSFFIAYGPYLITGAILLIYFPSVMATFLS
jgi:leader peptidase (prepilin peptidase) / N-methyltransferase